MVRQTSLSLILLLDFSLASTAHTETGKIVHHATYSILEGYTGEAWKVGDAEFDRKLVEIPRSETQKRLPESVSGEQLSTTKEPRNRLSPQEAEEALGLSAADRVDVQTWLDALGYAPGGADGVFGPRSRKAIARYQRDVGEEQTGYLDSRLYEQLIDAGPRASNRNKRRTKPSPDERFAKTQIIISKVVERYHYDKPVVDGVLAQRVLERFVDDLDPNRSFFLQADIDAIVAYPEGFAVDLKRGRLERYFKIFHRYRERVDQRLEAALALVDKGFDFSVRETYRFDRSNAPWAKSQSELDEIWRKRVKNDYLNLLLLGEKPEAITEELLRRYHRLETRINGFNNSDIAQYGLHAFTRSVDNHMHCCDLFRSGEVFSEDTGLVLQQQLGLVVIHRIVPGSPAAGSGLAPGDTILAVGQDPVGEMTDVVGWDSQDLADKIRGLKGSVVRLKVTKDLSDTSRGGREVSLVRAVTPLERRAVRGYIIEAVPDATAIRIGVIELSAFYRDFKAESKGNRDFLSSARDIRRILGELERAGVAGIVLDLRGNGGGAFKEAVEVAGLFIESGGVVRVKDSFGKVETVSDPDRGIAYAGPLAVLVDHESAAASEIVAAAVQDYQRGIVVGERTYGKGSVQTLVELNRFVPGSTEDLGRVHLTMAMFFRPNGGGIQLRGVVPDVVFPTDSDTFLREDTKPNPRPWSRIDPIQTPDYGFTMDHKVLMRHVARTRSDPDFRLSVDLNRLSESIVGIY